MTLPLNYTADHLVTFFKEYASIMIDDVELFPISTIHTPSILGGDARQIIASLEAEAYDLVITSPPYLNSFDYSDVYRPELFLGNYVSDNRQLAKIRKSTIRSHVQINWPRSTTFKSPMLAPIIEQVAKSADLWDSRIPIMIEAYFDDLYQVFKGIKGKLKIGGQIWLVVSTSAYAGIHIPVDFILAEAAGELGFALEEIHVLRDLRSSGQYWKNLNSNKPPLRESLVILKKQVN